MLGIETILGMLFWKIWGIINKVYKEYKSNGI